MLVVVDVVEDVVVLVSVVVVLVEVDVLVLVVVPNIKNLNILRGYIR